MRSRTLPKRFVTIDGLRGIAALAVVAFHFRLAIVRNTADRLPAWLDVLFRHGGLGVHVFFVISGIVIAFSVRKGAETWGYLGRFALRRPLRLDPPYWLTLALELALIRVGLMFVPSLGTPVPSLGQIGADLLYAQNVLDVGNIVPVFWTLCYEVQYYLFFVAGLIAWSSMRHRLPERSRPGVLASTLAIPFALSLALHFVPSAPVLQGAALDYWFEFFTGAVT